MERLEVCPRVSLAFRRWSVAVACALAWSASALGTSNSDVRQPTLPPVPVDGDFASNFFKPEFYMPLVNGADGAFGKDLEAQYYRVYYKVEPGREILILGEFPRARYFSVTVYDDHGAIVDTLHDSELVPLRVIDKNPFAVDGPAGREDQLYGITVRLGDSVTSAPITACGNANWDLTSNVLDARYRHNFYNRYSGEQNDFSVQFDRITVVHDEGIENTGGMIGIRIYLPSPAGVLSQLDAVKPAVWLRDVATGCAYAFTDVPGQTLDPGRWYQYEDVVNIAQAEAHNRHENDRGSILPPGGLDVYNGLKWFGGKEYHLHNNPDSGFLTALIGDKNSPARLNEQRRVMRLRFRLPAVPCKTAICFLRGDEQLRYWGLSVIDTNQTTLASLSDLNLTTDAQGYATIIATFGTVLPPHVNPVDGYTVISLDAADAQSARWVTLRNILPAAGFGCSAQGVPFHTAEHHPNGGYLGEYLPFADYPIAADLPELAVPFASATTSCRPPEDWPPPPCCSLVGAWALEGNALTFKAWRWGDVIDLPQVVNFATVPTPGDAGIAQDAVDFVGVAGALSFSAGESEKTFTVATLQDDLAEGDEVFDVQLSDLAQGAVLSTAQGAIVDDDHTTVSIKGAWAMEGEAITFKVWRWGRVEDPQTVAFTTGSPAESDATAQAPADYTALTGTLSFGPGETETSVVVATAQDELVEGAEVFEVTLSNPTDGLVLDAGLGTIVDDDVPAFEVAPTVVNEGEVARFEITRRGSAAESQSVDFQITATADDTAGAGDFVRRKGTLQFGVGESSQTVMAETLADTVFEGEERFSIILTNALGGSHGAIIGTRSAQATILDDDAAPRFSILPAAAIEGADIVFTVMRDGESQPVQEVEFAAGIAEADTASDGDFLSTSGTLAFHPGEALKTFGVVTIEDNLPEPDETFTVFLANPTGGALLEGASAKGTVIDDDAAVP